MAQEGLIKQLLEAGVHFGHQTKRWNPKMKRYIFGQRNGIYIIDLEQTAALLTAACDFLRSKTKDGADVLFVGTKKQAQEVIGQEAQRCGMFFVNTRWLGGTLTNFTTILKSVKRLKDNQARQESGELELLKKKEKMQIQKDMAKLSKNLTGIMNMKRLPGALFVVDPKKEEIAVKEARKLSIPVVGLIDTNSDPDMLTYVIPGNDDAIKAIKFVTQAAADAVLEGRRAYLESRGQKEETAQAVEAPPEVSPEAPPEAQAPEAEKPIIIDQKPLIAEEEVIEMVEDVVEKKLKKPDVFQVKMKKKPIKQKDEKK